MVAVGWCTDRHRQGHRPGQVMRAPIDIFTTMAESLDGPLAGTWSQMTTAAHQLQEFPRAECNFAILRQGLALPGTRLARDRQWWIAWGLTVLGTAIIPCAAWAILTLDPLLRWIKSRCPHVVAILHLCWSSLSPSRCSSLFMRTSLHNYT
jgi:hypothetical protein